MGYTSSTSSWLEGIDLDLSLIDLLDDLDPGALDWDPRPVPVAR